MGVEERKKGDGGDKEDFKRRWRKKWNREEKDRKEESEDTKSLGKEKQSGFQLKQTEEVGKRREERSKELKVRVKERKESEEKIKELRRFQNLSRLFEAPPLRVVQVSWHSAAALGDYSNGPPSQFPSLLLAEKEDDGREFRKFFLLSNKSIRKIRLPEAYGKVCRSSCGWIVTVGHDHAAQLINPLSRETINLPKVDTYHIRLGLLKWHEGITKLLIACDGLGEDPTNVGFTKGRCLVGGYQTKKMQDGYSTFETYKTKRFLLFAYDLKDTTWSRVKDLGKKTLFVGQSSTFWVEDTTGVIKSNCIYFTDDADLLYNKSRNGVALVDKTSKSISTQYPLASSTGKEGEDEGLLLECKPEEAAAIIQVVIQEVWSGMALELIKCRKDEDKTALAGGLQEDIPTMIDSLSGLGVKLNVK
ncbi:ribonuclease H-like domain-containing protein [Tanacetum coccineum]